MFSHVQLNPDNTFLRLIPAGELIEWDANNYCTAFALEKDGKAEEFRVKPYYTSAPPIFDALTQTVQDVDPALVDGKWVQQWSTRLLTSEELDIIRKAKIPVAVSRFQARAALHLAGLLSSVDALMADPATDPIAVLAWQDAVEFRRDSPTVAAMSAALGLSDTDLDNLFIDAAKIVA